MGLSRRLRYLDLRWSVARGVQVHVLERPGEWMQAADLEILLEQMRGIVRRGIGQDLDYGVLSGSPERLRNAVITLLRDKTSGDVVAFNALSFMDVELRGRPARVLHLGLVMVDPEFRTRGLSWVLYGLTGVLLFVRNGLRPMWISNVSQVPAIIGKVAEAFDTAWPNPFRPTRRSFDHITVAREIMRRHRAVFGVGEDAGFDEERFVITDAYTGGSDELKKTFEQAQAHRDARANALCEQQLDYRRGDDFLQIARLDMAVARHVLTREVPRDSLPALLWQLAFLLLGRILMPLWHWLDTSQQMAELRARTGP